MLHSGIIIEVKP